MPEQPHPLYLNGQWHEGSGSIGVENPATAETFQHVATIDRPRTKQAIEQAHSAFSPWRDTKPIERGDYLLKVAEILNRRIDPIGEIITRENGKPLSESKGEVKLSIDHLRWFAEEGRRAYGRMIPNQKPGKRHMVLQQPIGVAGAISPWNFPLVLAVRKVAPAMAAGCPVLLKPASATPLCAVELAKAMDEAKVPPGVFQLILGKASEMGAEMLENPLCRKVSFTGSTEVGKGLIEGASATVTRLSLELGGHSPVLVFDDADLELAIDGAMADKFRNNGQSCIAANRIFVQEGIYDRFMERLIDRVQNMKVGNGMDQGVGIGPLINQDGLETALKHIANARDAGAKVLTGGNQIGDQGYFIEPTVLADVPDEALCMKEETFAPIAPVTRFREESEAIERANNTRYGLAAYAFTSNLSRGLRVSEQLEAGTIGLNDPEPPSTSIAPFGGYKQSGWGRELGEEGLAAYMETKHVSIGGVE